MVIDLYPLQESEVRTRFPNIYQWVLERVKPERDANREPSRRDRWWWFGRTHEEYRSFTAGLNRYLVTPETSSHRWFTFLNGPTRADNMLVAIGLQDAYFLGALTSRFHVTWALRAGGWLGVGNDPRYSKSRCFDPFPFPVATDAQKQRIGALAEELDALSKKVLAEHDFLTMTKLYNVREMLNVGAPLDDSEKAIHDAGCVGVIHELHNQIDAAVADAYGWPAELSDDDILARLVALNKERAEEEKRGLVRWLRPEYQAARAKVRAAKEEQIEAELEAPEAEAPALPKDDAELVATLRRTLRLIGKPVEPKVLAQRFRDGGKATRRVERGLRFARRRRCRSSFRRRLVPAVGPGGVIGSNFCRQAPHARRAGVASLLFAAKGDRQRTSSPRALRGATC